MPAAKDHPTPARAAAQPSPASLRRLPLYLRVLRQFEEAGQEFVSCTHLAEELGFDATQIRKDIALTSIVGRPKVGYAIDQLIEALRNYLGWNTATEAFLVGGGSLGRALIGYRRLRDNQGLIIRAVFETDRRKVGRDIYGVRVLHLEELTSLAERMQVPLGILTVPGEAAQEVADMMIAGGIRALWNFTPAKLAVPEEVCVENVDITASLAILTKHLQEVR